MAITVDTQNIDEFPGTIRRVTIDLDSIVMTGYEGDENYLVKVSTTAYADENNTAIADLYITEMDAGWCKSTGLRGAAGKFVLDSSNYTFGIKMDETVSGTNETGYYTIALGYDGTAKTGEAIAADMETKIRAITCGAGDTGYQLAYKNCSVEYAGGKFKIISGTVARCYSGQYRSSVQVTPGDVLTDCTVVLGFDIPVTSEDLDTVTVTEALLATNYTHDTSPLYIGPNTGVQAGDSLVIKDAVKHNYFTALTVSGAGGIEIGVCTSGTNSYVGISQDYLVASGTMVQVVKEQDPDNEPNSYFGSVDALLRYGVKSLVNQIYYGS